MKYGIQVAYTNGTFQYAYSAKGGYINLCDNITDMALFVQKDSAVKALRAGRKLGYEPEGGEFQVVGVTYSVSEVTEVPAPPQKAGHVLCKINNAMGKLEYYGDSRTGSVDRPSWVNIQRATIFKSDLEAAAKLQEIKDYHNLQITYYTTEHIRIEAKFLAQSPSTQQGRYAGGWNSVGKWDVERAADRITQEQKYRDEVDGVTIDYIS